MHVRQSLHQSGRGIGGSGLELEIGRARGTDGSNRTRPVLSSNVADDGDDSGLDI